MTLVALFVSATKLAGILVTVTVAANAFSFSRYRKKFLRPFRSPIDESSDTLAVFNIEPADDEEGFFFGLATAPAHVEDKLDDAWVRFAEEHPCNDSEQTQGLKPTDAIMASATGDSGSQQAPSASNESRTSKTKKPLKIAMEAMIRGFEKYLEEEEELPSDVEHAHKIAAWHNVPHPKERLRFWSDPDTELKLAKDTGITVFRMGIDWTRIMPEEPVNSLRETVNYAALERLVVDSVLDLVDYWVTFNEPHVFCMLTYCAGAWPGGNPDMLEAATSALPTGVFSQAMHWMTLTITDSQNKLNVYGIFCLVGCSTSSKAIVGIAHHVSFMRPYGLFDVAAVTLANSLTLFPYIDSVSNKLDYIGINYYGQEVISGAGLKLVMNDEYSESGRGVYPDGLYRMLLQFHERYKHLKIPYIITENGVADGTDLIRRPYILEHLLATYAAMLMGVPVLGYLFWTISDNWEWADGYGPKFGLVAVDRAHGLARIPRPSYLLFSKVVTTGKVMRRDRARACYELLSAAKEQKNRPFYRAVDKWGLMYAGGLDQPIWRPFVERDWRFGHYEMEGLQDPLSRLSRFILSFQWKKKRTAEIDADELVLQPV
ncbi:glycosyl hydrolase 1 [Asimina triloba]